MPPAAAEKPLRPVPDLPSVVWEEPPTRGRAPIAETLAAEFDAVRSRPGHWARVKTFKSKSGASAAAKNLRQKPPDGRWEFRGSVHDGGSALYVRFLG